MKKILKLSLIFGVLAMVFAGCSHDGEGVVVGNGEVANAPKPKITAVGITVETLSVKRMYRDGDEWAVIGYKVTGKRQAGTETTHPYILYGLNGADGRLAFWYADLKDPSKEPNGYYTATMEIHALVGTYLDFSTLRAAIGTIATSF